MAQKTDAAFRKKMMKRREETTRQGVVVDKKGWKRGRVRILPTNGEDPAVEYNSFYVNELRKGCTAPRTFGVVDPLWDWLEDVYRTGDKGQKQHAKDTISRSTEYWASCIIRGDEGTASNPNVRIFRLPYGVYQYIVECILDEEEGENITEAAEGRDILIKKSGEGIRTEWKGDKMDCSPLSDDDDLMAVLEEMATRFNVADHFFSFDLETYSEIYLLLTGEEVPEDCLEALQELDENGAPETEEVEEEDDEEYEEEDEEGEDEEEEEEEEEEEAEDGDEAPEGVEFGVTRVSFNEGEVEGTVMGWSEDGETCDVVEDDGDENDPWQVEPAEWEVLDSDEEEEEEEEEEEAEEAEPAVRPAKKKAPNRPSGSKSGNAIRSGAGSRKKTTKKAKAKKTTTKKKASKKPAAKKKVAKKTAKKKVAKKTTKKKTSKKTKTRR